MLTQLGKAQVSKSLHERDKAFVIPNPWDVGSARLLAYLGFEALASTSGGFAFSSGCANHAIDRRTIMPHLSILASATGLPVSADLENGYGDSPYFVAETIRLAADAGVVGESIEDATDRVDDSIYGNSNGG